MNSLKSRTPNSEISGPRSITNVQVVTADARQSESRSRSETASPLVKAIGLTAGIENFFVLEGELLFIRKDITNAQRRVLGMKIVNGAISSFNGEPFLETETPEDFLARYQFVGIARGSYMVRDGVGVSSLIACQYGGAATLTNNSQKIIQQGDPVYITIPGFDTKLFNGSTFHTCPDKILPVVGAAENRTLSSILHSALSHIVYGELGTSEADDQFQSTFLESMKAFGTLFFMIFDSMGAISINHNAPQNQILDQPKFDPTQAAAYKDKLKFLSELFETHLSPNSGTNDDALVKYLFPGATVRRGYNPTDSYYLDEQTVGHSVDSQAEGDTERLLYLCRNHITNLCDVLQTCLGQHKGVRIGTALKRADRGGDLDINLEF